MRSCDRAPFGWACTRDRYHAGPCAAVEVPVPIDVAIQAADASNEGILRRLERIERILIWMATSGRLSNDAAHPEHGWGHVLTPNREARALFDEIREIHRALGVRAPRGGE